MVCGAICERFRSGICHFFNFLIFTFFLAVSRLLSFVQSVVLEHDSQRAISGPQGLLLGNRFHSIVHSLLRMTFQWRQPRVLFTRDHSNITFPRWRPLNLMRFLESARHQNKRCQTHDLKTLRCGDIINLCRTDVSNLSRLHAKLIALVVGCEGTERVKSVPKTFMKSKFMDI